MAEILNVTAVLFSDSSKNNLRYQFFVNRGTRRLRIRYTYDPKYLADTDGALKAMVEEGLEKYVLPQDRAEFTGNHLPSRLSSLITLSLDSPEGYIGAAHRHSPDQEHLIGGPETSPGFDPVEIVPGVWTACISTHNVAGRVTLHLTVEEEET